MKKLDIFKQHKSEQDILILKISLSVLIVAVLLILFEKVVGHLPNIGLSISTAFAYLSDLIAPFLMGFAIAYFMNPFMKFFETHFIKASKFFDGHRKLTRILCILLNYAIIIGGTVWIVVYLVPEIRNSIIAFATNVSEYSKAMNTRIQNIFDQIPFIDSKDVNNVVNRILAPLQDMSQNAPQILETIAANVYIFGRFTLNFIMAIFIAFYMLFDKERFSRKISKAVYAFSTEEKANRFLCNTTRIHHIFNNFIVGKAVDSLIIGILAFVGLSLIDAPFPLILALIVGVTNMIPYFGPFIGAIPAICITLLIDPPRAIAVGLFILFLQQFDGNFLGPKILGDSVDLSPLWVILAVMIGGAVMGPLGMFIGVPLLATVKVFGSEYIDRLYREKYPVNDPLREGRSGDDAQN